jgi:hypothetical protein
MTITHTLYNRVKRPESTIGTFNVIVGIPEIYDQDSKFTVIRAYVDTSKETGRATVEEKFLLVFDNDSDVEKNGELQAYEITNFTPTNKANW